MNILRKLLAIALTGTTLLATSPTAQAVPDPLPPPQEAPQANLSSSEIDAIVSPIALYPDQLIAQILGAATYPDQVAEASNWLNSNQGLQGDALTQAADQQPWDPSVKALTQFPSVLDQMAKNLAWTSALGDAAYNQQADVMASIQRLRRQAKAAGNLKSSQQIQVVQSDPQTIVIQPANPQVVYVPQYNPTVVYGTPYSPPGYSTGAMVATGLISFGVGVAVGAAINRNSSCGWGWGHGGWGCNWHGGHVVYQNNVYVSRSTTFYGANRSGYRNTYYGGNRPTQYNANNRYRGGNNRNTNVSGNTKVSGNTININAGKRGTSVSNTRQNRTNVVASNQRAGASNRGQQADRGYGQKPVAGSNSGAFGGYKAGGNARVDANRGKQSLGAGKAKPAPAAQPAKQQRSLPKKH